MPSDTGPDPATLTDHAARNRAMWDGYSDEYQATHGDDLAASGGYAWGTTQIPESELRILGDVAGRDILEFGCGAAQWSIALARLGARPVGLDLSERQLAARSSADGRGRRRVPARPCQRRGCATPGCQLRCGVLRPRGNDVSPTRTGRCPRWRDYSAPAGCSRSATTRRSRRSAGRSTPTRSASGWRSTTSGCTSSMSRKRWLPIAVRRMDPAVSRERVCRRGLDRAAGRAGRHQLVPVGRVAGLGPTLACRGDLAAAPRGLVLGDLAFDFVQPRFGRHIRRRPPVTPRRQRPAVGHLGAVRYRRPLELGERVVPLHEHLQPVSNLLQRERGPLVQRVSGRPVAMFGIMPGMPSKEGHLRRPEAVPQHLEQREVLQDIGADLRLAALDLLILILRVPTPG